MDIQAEKLSLIERLARVQDTRLILQVKEILGANEKSVGINPDGTLIGHEELISRAMESNKAIEEGRIITIEKFEEESKDW